jgi:hypothetical protein
LTGASKTLVFESHCFLPDKRLLGGDVRPEAGLVWTDALKFEQLFTARIGKLHKVRYYYEACNMEWLAPGD